MVRDDQPLNRRGTGGAPRRRPRGKATPAAGKGFASLHFGPLRLAPEQPSFSFRFSLAHRPRFANQRGEPEDGRWVSTRYGGDAAQGRHDDELFDKSAAWRPRDCGQGGRRLSGAASSLEGFPLNTLIETPSWPSNHLPL